MWKQLLVERAVSLSCLPWDDVERRKLWDELQDDIMGKLSLEECAALDAYCESVPSIGSLMIRSIMP